MRMAWASIDTAPLMEPVRIEAAVLKAPAAGWSGAAILAAAALLAAGSWLMYLGNREIR